MNNCHNVIQFVFSWVSCV